MPTNIEMKRITQSPHDRILWELSNHGKMTKNMLRQRTGIRKAELDITLADLEQEGRIIRAIGEDDELISLKDRS